MRKKDIIISFIISLAASVCFGFMQSTIEELQGLQFNGCYVFMIIILICICIFLGIELYGYKAIVSKINIRGKEYYDLFEEIIYYKDHKSRNMMEIDTLKWDYIFTPNSQRDAFLDLHAKWEIVFTASQKRIKEVNIGVHGGDIVSEESMNIKAYQEKSHVNYNFLREQDDCTFLNICLNSDVGKGKRDKITLEYDWEKFVITDRKDDYIYLFPYAIASTMKHFELVTKHPYKCKATVFVLNYRWGVGYERIEVNDANNIKLNIEISEEEFAEEHKIRIGETKVKNVYLVIFDKELKTATDK